MLMCFAYVDLCRVTSVRIFLWWDWNLGDGMAFRGLVGFIQVLTGTLLA